MHQESIIPATYLKIYAALLLLLALTVGVIFINLGPFNLLLALLIALAKALLVILFFMHVKDSSRIVWVYAALGFIWVFYLFAGTFADFLTR